MIRSLGRRGVAVYATGTKGSFVSYSRWHRAVPAEWGAPPNPGTLVDYLARALQEPGWIETVRGVGYRFRDR